MVYNTIDHFGSCDKNEQRGRPECQLCCTRQNVLETRSAGAGLLIMTVIIPISLEWFPPQALSYSSNKPPPVGLVEHTGPLLGYVGCISPSVETLDNVGIQRPIHSSVSPSVAPRHVVLHQAALLCGIQQGLSYMSSQPCPYRGHFQSAICVLTFLVTFNFSR